MVIVPDAQIVDSKGSAACTAGVNTKIVKIIIIKLRFIALLLLFENQQNQAAKGYYLASQRFKHKPVRSEVGTI